MSFNLLCSNDNEYNIHLVVRRRSPADLLLIRTLARAHKADSKGVNAFWQDTTDSYRIQEIPEEEKPELVQGVSLPLPFVGTIMRG